MTELGDYAAAAFFTYEELLERLNEANVRCDELERERDLARNVAVQLEQENADLRRQLAASTRFICAAEVEYIGPENALRRKHHCGLPARHDGAHLTADGVSFTRFDVLAEF